LNVIAPCAGTYRTILGHAFLRRQIARGFGRLVDHDNSIGRAGVKRFSWQNLVLLGHQVVGQIDAACQEVRKPHQSHSKPHTHHQVPRRAADRSRLVPDSEGAVAAGEVVQF
jgi:hypothetical protein